MEIFTAFEHRRILGHHLICFGNPIEWNLTKTATKNQAKWVALWWCLLDLQRQLSLLLFSRSRQEWRSAAAQHLAPILPIYSAIPLVPPDFFQIFTDPFCDVATAWCHSRPQVNLVSKVSHAVVSHVLHSVSHTLPARIRRLWLCGQRRRACGPQQIRVYHLAI